MNVVYKTGHEALQQFHAGNRRFREGARKVRNFRPEELADIAQVQQPSAGVIACSDSRLNVDTILDQPLGTLFTSRLPGNVAADSSLWMVDIAISEFKVPLVLVLGHTGCLAVKQLLDGDNGGPGGIYRHHISEAVQLAKFDQYEDLLTRAVERNTLLTMDRLTRESEALRRAMANGNTVLAGAIYEMETGTVRILEVRDTLA